MAFNQLSWQRHPEECEQTLVVEAYSANHPDAYYSIDFPDGEHYEGWIDSYYESDNAGELDIDEEDPRYDEFDQIVFDLKSERCSGARNYRSYLTIDYRDFPSKIIDVTTGTLVYPNPEFTVVPADPRPLEALRARRQERFDPSSPIYVPWRPQITLSDDQLQRLYYKKEERLDIGDRLSPAVVRYPQVIGKYYDVLSGTYVPTSRGAYHHTTVGAFVVPASPGGAWQNLAGQEAATDWGRYLDEVCDPEIEVLPPTWVVHPEELDQVFAVLAYAREHPRSEYKLEYADGQVRRASFFLDYMGDNTPVFSARRQNPPYDEFHVLLFEPIGEPMRNADDPLRAKPSALIPVDYRNFPTKITDVTTGTLVYPNEAFHVKPRDL